MTKRKSAIQKGGRTSQSPPSALDQHELAIGIGFSGTGSDGTMGVRAIKGGTKRNPRITRLTLTNCVREPKRLS